MSLLNSASLVVTPNGYKEGTLYSVIPNTTLGDMTVVRATTATRVNSAGLIESVANNVPRLDYSNGTCPSILVEPQRTNLLQYSEQFNNAYWELGSVASVTANTTISPDGTQNADTLTANGAGSLFVRYNVFLGTAQTCSNSVYAKKNNNRYVGLRNSGTISAHDVFDFDTKTWTNNSGAVLSYDELPNGWFRLKSVNTDAVNLNYYWSVIPAVSTAGAENTTASNLNVYIWGAQAEQNASYPTSYIPTTSAAVTRNADVISKTGISALIGQTEGTLFVDVDYDSAIVGNKMLLGLANNVSNFIYLFIDISTIVCNIFSGGTPQCSLQYILPSNARYKIAVAYKNNDFLLYVNGTQVAIDTSGSVPSTSVMYLGNDFTSVYNTANINSAALFPTRLTNAELISLTTI